MLVLHDALDVVFLGCFFFGLIFSIVALLLGVGHIGGHDGVHVAEHIGHGGHVGHGGQGAHADHGGHDSHDLSFLNLPTLLGFVAWFGGVGYLARNGLGIGALLAVVVALAGGFVGGYIVYRMLRMLTRFDGELDPEDFRLPGTVATVTSSIRAGGTGEIIYEQAGVRQVSAARSMAGTAIPRDTEVVVLREQDGVAFVELLDTLLEERHPDLLLEPTADGTADPDHAHAT